MSAETSGIAAVQARIADISARFGAAPVVRGNGVAASMDFAAALANVQAEGTGALGGPRDGGTGGVSGDAVVAGAKRYLGVPYVWGGTDPAKGLDCSGLVQRVFKDLGISLPRVSSDQAREGVAVPSMAQARPGDLLAFDNTSARPGVDHIAIYVGNGRMIEAPRTGLDVRITDVPGTPVAIRRIVPGHGSAQARGVQAGGSGRGSDAVPYAHLFRAAAARHDVPAELLAAVARTESGFDPGAVSPAGARGLMQFMPATARELGVNPFDPASAVDGAARLLRSHLNRFGSVPLALAAYNAGPGAVQRYGGVPPYSETRTYVQRVQAFMRELSL